MIEVGLERLVINTPVQLKATTTPTYVQDGTIKVYAKDNGSGTTLLCYKDDAGTEVCTTAVGFASAHNLLSATHTDSLAGTVVRGDLVVGNSTPAWARFAKGASGTVLQMGANDPAWVALSTLSHNSLADLATGDVHTQYSLLAGRSGGQVLTGGTAAADDLTLKATSGVGAGSEAIILQVGNNGGTIIATFGPAGLVMGSAGKIDLSAIAAGSPNLVITATNDTPTVAFSGGGNAPTTAPAGYLEISVGGNARYIPFWA